jgi:hypothetical protein
MAVYLLCGIMGFVVGMAAGLAVYERKGPNNRLDVFDRNVAALFENPRSRTSKAARWRVSDIARDDIAPPDVR